MAEPRTASPRRLPALRRPRLLPPFLPPPPLPLLLLLLLLPLPTPSLGEPQDPGERGGPRDTAGTCARSACWRDLTGHRAAGTGKPTPSGLPVV